MRKHNCRLLLCSKGRPIGCEERTHSCGEMHTKWVFCQCEVIVMWRFDTLFEVLTFHCLVATCLRRGGGRTQLPTSQSASFKQQARGGSKLVGHSPCPVPAHHLPLFTTKPVLPKSPPVLLFFPFYSWFCYIRGFQTYGHEGQITYKGIYMVYPWGGPLEQNLSRYCSCTVFIPPQHFAVGWSHLLPMAG